MLLDREAEGPGEAVGCIDLASSGTGEMKKHYGFIYVDMDDQGKGTLKSLSIGIKKVLNRTVRS